ncbi:MAG: hypothetical protein WBR26_17475, partial [Candidatus Acidiferrum sp.]
MKLKSYARNGSVWALADLKFGHYTSEHLKQPKTQVRKANLGHAASDHEGESKIGVEAEGGDRDGTAGLV